MAQAQQQASGLDAHGIQNAARVFWNLSVPALYEESVRRYEAQVAAEGAPVCRTGQHTGRSPYDKFVVREPSSADRVWWSKVNRPTDPRHFDALHQRVLAHADGKELVVQDCYAGADPRYRLRVRIITEQAWHSLSPAEYDDRAHELARMFAENFRTFEAEAAPETVAAGPQPF